MSEIKIKSSNILLFMLGLFSTLQILTIFNITIFSYILCMTFVFFIVTHKFKFKKNKYVHIYLICCILTTFFIFLNPDFENRYFKSAIMSFIYTIMVLFIPLSLSNFDESSYFIKGFTISCYIQIFWAIFQIAMFNYLNVDINDLIFNGILNYNIEASSYRDGMVVCTGLHWHAANLIPIIVYIFLKKNLFLKIICIFVTYYSKSATMMIALILCMFFLTIYYLKKNYSTPISIKIKLYQFVILTFAIIFIILNFEMIFGKIYDSINMLVKRFMEINSTVGGTSSAVHFDYYTSLPDIFSKISIISSFFGVGMSSSGLIFSDLYGQYVEMEWVVESDFVNILLSQGILGFISFYLLMFNIIVYLKKKDYKNMSFILVLILCGVTYNVQFHWVILVELILREYDTADEKLILKKEVSENVIECCYSNI